MAASTRTFTALDSAAARGVKLSTTEQDHRKNFAAVASMAQNAYAADRNNLGNTSSSQTNQMFEAGRVFERHRKNAGFTQTSFLEVFFDLEGDRRAAFRQRGNLDFCAGRLFERFSIRTTQQNAEFLTADRFKEMLSKFGTGQPIIDPFDAGRIYEKYAVTSSAEGLTQENFLNLCRVSELGENMASRLENDTGIIDGHADAATNNKHSRRFQSKYDENYRDRTKKYTHRPPKVSTFGTDEDSEASSDNESANGVQWARTTVEGDHKLLLSQIELTLDKLTKVDQQIAGLESELHAEASLKYELPEAYSEPKERMIQKYIAAIKQRRAKYIDTLKRLKRRSEMPSHKDEIHDYAKFRGNLPGIVPDFPLADYELM